MNKSKALTKLFALCCGIFILSFIGFFMIGCSPENDGSFVKEDENRFEIIEDTDKFLCEGSDRSRLIYDRETFMVYYNINSTYNHNISPYLVNGHFAKYDPKTNGIVELKDDTKKDN